MTWTSQRIRATLSDMRAFGDDFTLVEVKEAAEGLPENLPETVCAFANMPQGGTVLLGVSQRQNFAVTGIASPNDGSSAFRVRELRIEAHRSGSVTARCSAPCS